MNKFKILFLSVLSSLLLLGTSSVVLADVYPGTNYEILSDLVVKEINTGEIIEFYSIELKEAFLESKSVYQTRSNATGVADNRSKYSHSYYGTSTSGAMTGTAYGGAGGATLTLSAGIGFTDPKYGWGFNLETSVSHNVPPYTYGYIRLKSSYKVNVYKLEVRYLGTNKWVPAGETRIPSNKKVWSELATWK